MCIFVNQTVMRFPKLQLLTSATCKSCLWPHSSTGRSRLEAVGWPVPSYMETKSLFPKPRSDDLTTVAALASPNYRRLFKSNRTKEAQLLRLRPCVPRTFPRIITPTASGARPSVLFFCRQDAAPGAPCYSIPPPTQAITVSSSP